MRATPHKLSMTVKALIRDGAQPGSLGVSRLQEEVAATVLGLVPDATVLKDGTPLLAT